MGWRVVVNKYMNNTNNNTTSETPQAMVNGPRFTPEKEPVWVPTEARRRYKPVACIAVTGELVKTYAQAMDAARSIQKQTGVSSKNARSGIYTAVSRQKPYMGYRWCYIGADGQLAYKNFTNTGDGYRGR